MGFPRLWNFTTIFPVCFTEALEVYHFPLPEEADDVGDVGIVAEPEDVVVGHAGLLFGGQVFGQIADDIALHADARRTPGKPRGCRRVDAGCMVHKVGGKGAVLSDLLIREIAGELVDDGTDHFQVPQFLGTYIGFKMDPGAEGGPSDPS